MRMKWSVAVTLLALAGGAVGAAPAHAQQARPTDVETPEALVAAVYESLARAPGEHFDWDRFRSLHLPEALLMPNLAQTGGESLVMTVEEFIDWVDTFYEQNVPIGSPQDQGFVEAGVHLVKHEYGDVVQVMSTYEKHFHDSDELLGRGINAITMVRRDDRWWILSTAWDEENAAGPVPRKYMPAPEPDPADVATIDALIDASYATLQREPGKWFPTDRYHSLRLRSSIQVPNAEQSGGRIAPRTVDDHVTGIESIPRNYPDYLGGPNDRGFAEDEIHRSVQRYGDVAHVQSTYEKRHHGSEEVIGRGVNFYTLVFDGTRWWMTGAAWDEEAGAGPIPPEFLPAGSETASRSADEDAVRKVIVDAYVQGLHANRDAEAMRRGFDPSFVMQVNGRDGVMSITLQEWLDRMQLDGTANENTITHEFLRVDVSGDTAGAALEVFSNGERLFTDFMHLYRRDGEWRIVGKAFERH